MRGCEERYAQVLKEKAEAVKASGTPDATEILQLEEQIAYFENQKKEIKESQGQVQKTKKQIEDVLNKLSSMLSAAKNEQAQTKAKLDELIVKASL